MSDTITTVKQALEELDSMQRQIIHGPTIFKEIADVMRLQRDTARAAHTALAAYIDATETEDENILLANRILANGNPKGKFYGPVENAAKQEGLG